MHDSQGDPLDNLIDETARSMTQGIPRESLRERVRRRLDRPSLADRASRVPMWQMAVAAASAAGIALVVSQNVSRPPDVSSGSGPAPGDPRMAAAAVAAPPTAGAAPLQSASGPDPARPRRARAVSVLAPPELIIIESLEVEPIGPRLVAVDSIPDSMPIVIEPLQVEPLSME